MYLTNIMLNIRVHISGPDSHNIKFETLIYGVISRVVHGPRLKGA